MDTHEAQPFAGKVAIVTGAAGGIGRAVARLLAERGARVVVVDLKAVEAEETVGLIREAGGEAFFVRADVTAVAEAEAAVARAEAAYGGIDILHNNAAIIAHHDRLDEVSVEEFRRIVDVDLNALFLMARTVAPRLARRGGGVIVNTSSGAGLVGYAPALAYTAAKAGVLGLTNGLANLLREDRIRVNAVLPGMTDTPMLRESRTGLAALEHPETLLKPPDIARAVAYMAANEDVNGAWIEVRLTPTGPEYRRYKQPLETELVEDVP
jgi:NAD(P)-dependent dehydrogenase (short-subunit alcohol dehydrogenase family)